jgi:hypothetical protein
MEEHSITFVNSRGLLKSCNFHSNHPISSCGFDFDGYLNKMLEQQYDNMSIYVCNTLLPYFVEQILIKINKKFTLVSGDSDECVPRECLSNKQFHLLINSIYLVKWFSQNTNIYQNPKLIQMPIGLDYHTILSNPNFFWRIPSEGYLPIEQENILTDIKNNALPFDKRICQLYVNFNWNDSKFGERHKSLIEIPKNLLANYMYTMKRTDNWKNTCKYAFVLSPFGQGWDCHRTWEALCLGCIPVVKAPFFTKLFEDLPVLNVNEWSDINQELLQKTIESFKNRKFNFIF